MSRCAGIPAELAVPGFTLFPVKFRVNSSDESDCLDARAERPVTGLRRLGARQRAGVRALRLGAKFLGVARPARVRPGIIGTRGSPNPAGQCSRNEYGRRFSQFTGARESDFSGSFY